MEIPTQNKAGRGCRSALRALGLLFGLSLVGAFGLLQLADNTLTREAASATRSWERFGIGAIADLVGAASWGLFCCGVSMVLLMLFGRSTVVVSLPRSAVPTDKPMERWTVIEGEATPIDAPTLIKPDDEPKP